MIANEFYPENFWQAAQAIEKYLKAGLVANGESAVVRGKSKDHSLIAVRSRHRSIFNNFTDFTLEKPSGLADCFWSEETLDQFLLRLDTIGSPDSRYGLMGWTTRPGDLFKLDQVVWAFRRLAVQLDATIPMEWLPDPKWASLEGLTCRKAIELAPLFSFYGPMKELEQKVGFSPESRGELLHAWNFSFWRASSDFQRSPTPSVAMSVGGFKNSFLVDCVREAKREGPLDPILCDGLRWMIKNIRLPNIMFNETAPFATMKAFFEDRIKRP